MPSLTKATQTVLDELDEQYAAGEIDDKFMPRARNALAGLCSRDFPRPCFESVARVIAALAQQNDGYVPTGHGAAYVRHFGTRNEQIAETISKVTLSIDSRFALIELAALASMTGGWPDQPILRRRKIGRRKAGLPKSTLDMYLADAAKIPSTAHVERERWRVIIAFLLESPDATVIVARNVACALAWCGYVLPSTERMNDEVLAKRFGEDRASFVRNRQDALRWVAKLHEFSTWVSVGAVPIAKSQHMAQRGAT